MLTIDTNVLVRFLVVLDEHQSAVARRLVADNTLVILQSVILETEWVLRSAVKMKAKDINALFRDMLATENIVVEKPEVLHRILDLHDAGMDFADAFHVCSILPGMTFVTFDRDLVKYARKLMPNASVELAV